MSPGLLTVERMYRKVAAYFLAIIILLACMAGCAGNGGKDKPERKISTARPNYLQDIAPFVFENCATCHSYNSLAPFALTTYEEISGRAAQLAMVIDNHSMPPWKPDPSYSDLIGQPHIEPHAAQMIKDWMKLGFPYGPTADEMVYKEPVITPETADSGQIVYQIQEGFSHPGDGKDYYYTYKLELNNKDTLYLSKIQIQHENKKIFHHAWLLVVNEGVNLDSLDPEVFIARKARAIGGFLPNMTRDHLRDGYAKMIPPGTQFVFNVHYGPATEPMTDQPSIVFTKAKKGQQFKSVEVLAVREDSLLEPKLFIKADTVQTFHVRHTLTEDAEVLSAIPHMHYLGRKFKAFAVRRGTSDTIPLIRINNWDFNWQNMYYLREPVYLKKGDVIYVEGLFDNTGKNPFNPTVPPVDVSHGERSKDEMLELLLEVVY